MALRVTNATFFSPAPKSLITKDTTGTEETESFYNSWKELREKIEFDFDLIKDLKTIEQRFSNHYPLKESDTPISRYFLFMKFLEETRVKKKVKTQLKSHKISPKSSSFPQDTPTQKKNVDLPKELKKMAKKNVTEVESKAGFTKPAIEYRDIYKSNIKLFQKGKIIPKKKKK